VNVFSEDMKGRNIVWCTLRLTRCTKVRFFCDIIYVYFQFKRTVKDSRFFIVIKIFINNHK